ncbi:hypothetical protein LCGC14_1909040 [marine sediment metagenome]|uniref:Uncharacterized protein n=1 Tax=marine sediment metagenome TaxID=412755 RepID=A0A0F9FUQ7_9ZZZZ
MASYASLNSPTFSVAIDTSVGRKTVQFKNKSLELNLNNPIEKELSEALDKLILTRPNIAREIRIVDRESALAIARAHQSLQRVAATKGPVSSMDNPALSAQLDRRADELRAMGTDEGKVQEMLDKMRTDLQLTVKSSQQVRDQPGFVPDKLVKQPVEQVETSKPAPEPGLVPNPRTVFSNLTKVAK